MPGGARRLFAAVQLSPELRLKLRHLQDRLLAGRDDVRIVPSDNLHITLRFLGEVEEERIGAVTDACARTATAFAGFQLEVRGVGSFPARNPRILWAGVTDGGDNLIEINARLEQLLQAAGFAPDDKPYRPHLTIGRVRPAHGLPSLKRIILTASDLHIGRQPVDGIALLDSRLGREAPVYTRLAWWPLSG